MRGKTGLFTALAVTFVIGAPVAAHAQDGALTFVMPGYAPTSAAGADLAEIAAERGISVEAANAQVGWQDAFAQAATTLEAAYLQSYAGAEITSTAPPVAVVRFTGKPPAGAMDVLGSLPKGLEVRVEGGEALTQREENQLVKRVHAAALAEVGGNSLSSEYSRAEGRVVVNAPGQSGVTGSNESMAAGIANAVSRVGEKAPRVNFVSGGQNRDTARIGGGRLEFTGSGQLACTAGFNVINGSGTTTGVATAGHCTNDMTHENADGVEKLLSNDTDYIGTYGDFQWATSTDYEYDDFYYNFGSVRDTSAIASPVVNQTLCRFGHATGAHCAEVEANSICVTTSSGTACNLTRMKNAQGDVGDSGGPWYYGNTAYGFHKGTGGTVLGARDVFSKATLIDDARGVWVRK
jgi:hypothetical protein